MKRKFWIGFGAAALLATIPVLTSTPVSASLKEVGSAISQRIRRPEIKLVMGVEKQIIEIDDNGQEKLVWENLEGNVTVQPGDTLRYTIQTANEGEIAAKNLVITQPVPEQTTYILNTAVGNSVAQITYSIDSGETFVEEPMIEVTLPNGTVELQPAPAEQYSHVRWDFTDTVEPEIALNVSYDVAVQ